MTETVAIIDYGSGNLRSAEKAMVRAARDGGLDQRIIVTRDPDQVARADRVLLPGVGAFGDCRAGLAALDGMADALHEHVQACGKPFLGICVGMQLLAMEGFEHGRHTGMGWVDGTVKPLAPADPALKIPHMGWNTLSLTQAGADHPVAGVLSHGEHAYFVHSYHMQLHDPSCLLATTQYGESVTAIVGQGNIIGTQFHPEKSQRVGLAFLQAFMEWKP